MGVCSRNLLHSHPPLIALACWLIPARNVVRQRIISILFLWIYFLWKRWFHLIFILPSFFFRLRLEASAFWHHLNKISDIIFWTRSSSFFFRVKGRKKKGKGKGHLINIRILWGLQVLMHPSQIWLFWVKPYDVFNLLREGASLQRKGIALGISIAYG